jgi:hypothetical protein
MFAPTVQEYSDQRFDHSQRIGCKGGRPEFVKQRGPERLACVYNDDVAAYIKAGRLIRMMEKGARAFAATVSITASRRQASPAFTALIAALCYKFQLRKENDLRSAAAGDAACCRNSLVSAPLVASTDDISESQFSGATLISRIAR